MVEWRILEIGSSIGSYFVFLESDLEYGGKDGLICLGFLSCFLPCVSQVVLPCITCNNERLLLSLVYKRGLSNEAERDFYYVDAADTPDLVIKQFLV